MCSRLLDGSAFLLNIYWQHKSQHAEARAGPRHQSVTDTLAGRGFHACKWPISHYIWVDGRSSISTYPCDWRVRLVNSLEHRRSFLYDSRAGRALFPGQSDARPRSRCTRLHRHEHSWSCLQPGRS